MSKTSIAREHRERGTDEICRLCDRDDLSPSSSTLTGPLDDTGQIQQLDLGSLVLDHTRNSLHMKSSNRSVLDPRSEGNDKVWHGR